MPPGLHPVKKVVRPSPSDSPGTAYLSNVSRHSLRHRLLRRASVKKVVRPSPPRTTPHRSPRRLSHDFRTASAFRQKLLAVPNHCPERFPRHELVPRQAALHLHRHRGAGGFARVRWRDSLPLLLLGRGGRDRARTLSRWRGFARFPRLPLPHVPGSPARRSWQSSGGAGRTWRSSSRSRENAHRSPCSLDRECAGIETAPSPPGSLAGRGRGRSLRSQGRVDLCLAFCGSASPVARRGSIGGLPDLNPGAGLSFLPGFSVVAEDSFVFPPDASFVSVNAAGLVRSRRKIQTHPRVCPCRAESFSNFLR